MRDETDPQAVAAQSWFGYGRWDAPYWFIGMEPGGDDTHASYDAWKALDPDRIGLVDCREHHLWKRTVLGVKDPKWTRWHDERPGRRTQPTWRRLIQLLFGFKGMAADLDAVFEYQKQRWGAIDGETAVVELGALHAPGLFAKVDRETFRGERIRVLRSNLLDARPVFAVCYGYTFREQFQDVIGSDFDADGFIWAGPTLCVLTPGPTSFLRGGPG